MHKAISNALMFRKPWPAATVRESRTTEEGPKDGGAPSEAKGSTVAQGSDKVPAERESSWPN